MFLNFFQNLKTQKLPVSLKEFLVFLEALSKGIGRFEITTFYYLARSCLVKNEKHIGEPYMKFNEFDMKRDTECERYDHVWRSPGKSIWT